MKIKQGKKRQMGHIKQGGWEGFKVADAEADKSGFSDNEVDRMIGGRCWCTRCKKVQSEETCCKEAENRT